MDKGRQPTLWNNHNLDILANEAFRRGEEKRRHGLLARYRISLMAMKIMR